MGQLRARCARRAEGRDDGMDTIPGRLTTKRPCQTCSGGARQQITFPKVLSLLPPSHRKHSQ
jgi:hypothetical protein